MLCVNRAVKERSLFNKNNALTFFNNGKINRSLHRVADESVLRWQIMAPGKLWRHLVSLDTDAVAQ